MERTFTEDHSLDRCGRSVPHLPWRLFQGGVVPMYAIVVREYFSPQEAGMRIGVMVGATLLGIALGGWMSGAIFDLTGSYRATFVNAFYGTC